MISGLLKMGETANSRQAWGKLLAAQAKKFEEDFVLLTAHDELFDLERHALNAVNDHGVDVFLEASKVVRGELLKKGANVVIPGLGDDSGGDRDGTGKGVRSEVAPGLALKKGTLGRKGMDWIGHAPRNCS